MIHVLISDYINCLFVCLLNFLLSLCFLSYLFTSLLVYFLIYLSISPRMDPFRFQARGRRRLPNLALAFFGSFYVVVYLVSNARLLLLSVSEMTLFCVGWDVKP